VYLRISCAALGINSEYHVHSYGKICLRRNDLLNYRTDILKKDVFMKLMISALAAVASLLSIISKKLFLTTNDEVKN
jgi:hypothetical protein